MIFGTVPWRTGEVMGKRAEFDLKYWNEDTFDTGTYAWGTLNLFF